MGVYDVDDNSTDFIDALCLNLGDLILGDEFTAPMEYRSWLQYFTTKLSFRLVLEDYENGTQACTDILCFAVLCQHYTYACLIAEIY